MAGTRVGVLVQTNFGGVLTIGGAPVGGELGRYSFANAGRGRRLVHDRGRHGRPAHARDLKRLAARAVFGLARTGSSYSNGSGDFAIAFSTAPATRVRRGGNGPVKYEVLPTDALSPLFEMALEATEEAVYNSLLRATTVESRYGRAEAIPIDRVREILAKYRRSSSRYGRYQTGNSTDQYCVGRPGTTTRANICTGARVSQSARIREASTYGSVFANGVGTADGIIDARVIRKQLGRAQIFPIGEEHGEAFAGAA